MQVISHWTRTSLLVAGIVAALGVWTVVAQAPLPIPGQQQGQGRGRGAGGRGADGTNQAAPPVTPVVSPVATISGEVTGPGPMFSSLMDLPPGDDPAHFQYNAKEYFVSGTANGEPYRTRLVIRRPNDNRRFSGIVLGESMHPSGNAWVFHFAHTYMMSSNHIGWEVVTSTPAQFTAFNEARYKEMQVAQGQASEIIAQVGAMLRTSPNSPLAGLTIRKMVFGGTSASSGVLLNYLPTHMTLRLPDMKPIVDGFLPTSNGSTNVPQIDVPLIHVPTMTEVNGGNVPTRQDSDEAGNQYRVYEFAGMAHLDTRDVAAFRPDPCRYPISMFPMGAYIGVALHHLVEWVDKGTVPPRSDRILMDRNTAGDGSMMALDEHGNPRGGIRSPYVDVPVMRYAVRNAGAMPPVPNAQPWVALRGEAGINQLCGLLGYQLPLPADTLKRLYRNKADYVSKFEARLKELERQGWSLPVSHAMFMADAAKVTF